MGIKKQIGQLTAAEWAAVSIAGREAGKHRSDLDAGTHEVDLLLRIKGKLDVGEDGETSTKPRVPLDRFTSWLIDQACDVAAIEIAAGNGKAAMRTVLLDILQHAPDGVAATTGSLAALQGITAALESAFPRKASTRRGSVTGILDVGMVEATELTPAVAHAIHTNTRAIVFAEAE